MTNEESLQWVVESRRELQAACALVTDYVAGGRFNPFTGRRERIFPEAFLSRVHSHMVMMMIEDRQLFQAWLADHARRRAKRG